MANYYTYGKVPTAEETIYGPLSQGYADGGVAEPKIPPGLEAAFLRMRGQSPEQLAAKAEATAQTKPQREVLSGLLQAGQFDKAFKYAKDEGVQNLLIDPTELKTLRGPFSNDEMKSFFAAMPKDLMGEQEEKYVKFKPEQALEQSLQVAQIPKEGIGAGPLGEFIGYPNVQGAFEPQEVVKEMNAFDKLIRAAVLGGVAYAGGSALAGLSGTGGGLSGALKTVSGIPAKVGGAVAETLGLPVTSTIGKTALGNAIITGGTTAAKGGDLEDVLKAGLLSAGLTYVSAPVIDKLKDAAQAVGSKLGITTAAPASATGAAVSDALSDVATDELLKEVTITATRPALSSLIGTTVSALPTSTKVDLPEPQVRTEPSPLETAEAPEDLEEVVVTSERPRLENLLNLSTAAIPTTTPVTTPEPSVLEPEPVAADREIPEEPVEQDLEEITVTAERPPLSNLLNLAPVAIPTTSPVDLAKPDYIEDVVIPEEEPLEEVTVTADRPPLSNLLNLAPIAVPTSTPVDVAKPDYIEDVVIPEEEDLAEVKVTATRPPLSNLVNLAPIALPTTTPVDLPEPEVVYDQIVYPEEVVVETTKPPDPDLVMPPIKFPLKTPVDLPEPKINEPNQLKDLMDKYANLENLLKLIASTASVTSKPKTTAPTTAPSSMTSALPKYTLTRKQLSPDIDYYTYGTRPEAKFFEQGFQLEKPTQPAGPQPEGPPASPLNNPAVVSSQPSAYAAPSNVGPMVAEEDPERYREMLADMQSFLTVTPREGATEAELEELRNRMAGTTGKAAGGLTGYAKGGSKSSRYVDGPGSGRDDKIPALLSDGEYVIDAETLALLGDGSTKEGARRMDKFRANIRRHKGRALSRGQISPDAKTPEKYMGGGLA